LKPHVDYGAVTMERLLTDAGLAPGMRVLDLGCGRGLVSRMARGIVGESGAVVGLDRDLSWVEKLDAADRFDNVTYESIDLNAVAPGWRENWGSFDAIIGRRVLMYLKDPSQTLRALCKYIRPGGVAVFQEIDFSMVPQGTERLPLHAQATAWIRSMIEREGANPQMGFHLATTLRDAGLTVQHTRADAMVQCPEVSYDIAEVLKMVSPRLFEHGVVTEAELGLETLAARLAEERAGTNATFVTEVYFGAWAAAG
jgi:cyclopropane fatty-acyl-phospholipid synthase-like methyltransferase